MFCYQCGSDNRPDNRFCGQCGAMLNATNGDIRSSASKPTGPVSSEFRREVEQQQIRLQRLDDQPVRSYSELATSTHVESSPDADTITSTPDRGAAMGSDLPGRLEHMMNSDTESTSSDVPFNEAPISGPSFLGLSGAAPKPEQDLTYLYEDEPGPGRARTALALLIAVAFLAFVAYEWKQNPNWQTTIVGKLGRSRSAAVNTTPAQQTSADEGAKPAPASVVGSGNTDQNNSTSTTPVQTNGVQQGDAQRHDEARPTQAEAGIKGSNDAGASKNEVAHTESSPPTVGDTNSTGVAGEQAAADNDGEDAAQSGDNTEAHPPAKKERTKRNAVPLRPPKEEEPGKDLVAKADAYLYGRGTPQSCDQALVYLRTAANRGNATARSKLGGLYATGHCVPLDRAEAYNWFTLAREAGNKNVWIDRNREILWSKMTADEKARAMEPPR